MAPARAAPLNDNSYTDLKPGWKLRAVMPLTRDGGLRAAAVSREGEGGTIFVSPGDVDGYQTLYYAVEAGRHGQVRLRFVSAEATREGKTVGERGAPAQPFRLPRGSAHVRLIYLIRASQSDHDMAIVKSRRMEDLNAFTGRLKTNPEI